MSDQKRPQPRPGIQDITIYKPGVASVAGIEKVIKLSANETPLGPSPKAVAAFEAAAGSIERYPEGSAAKLRSAIGEVFDLDPERIVVGAGSDEVLQMLGHAYIGEGDEVIYTEHAFVIYPVVTKSNGGIAVEVPETDCRADVDAILARVTDKTRVIYLANPNNPTGTWIPDNEIRRLHAALPGDVLLVIDEAYGEYVHEEGYKSALNLVEGNENVVVTRTFSKIYGLASLRLGWGYCPQAIADDLNRIRGPFNTSVAAQAAGIEAIRDREHVARSVEHNDTWMRWLEQQLGGLAIDFTPGVGNFILMHFGDEPGKTAAEANDFLLSKGIILRFAPAPKLKDSIRLTIGLEEENRKVVEALAEFLGR